MFAISKIGWWIRLIKFETQVGRRPRLQKWWKSRSFDVIQLIVFTGALVWLTLRGADSMNYVWQWHRIPQYLYRIIDGEFIPGPLVDGLFVTLEIGAYSIVLGLTIGLVTAFLRLSESFSGRLLAKVYLEIVRNTPLLVQLFVFYFILGPILEMDRFWIAVLCISFFEGSFASEIMRAGILSVSKGQWEASDSVGLSRGQAYRYVILPQAIPIMLPPLVGILVNLIKHSAIVSVIAVFDLTTTGLDIISETFMAFEIWLVVAAIYLVLTVTLSLGVSGLEKYFKDRRSTG
jgi:polar amino acid transport system permease protein|tara:strand:+ start:1486 stop:2355 length:870 start_codon:yes stop_codon:yes gene_type:complete